MEITELVNHPERLDRDSLYELRALLAVYPYFQTVRLLLLQNLYLLHDPSFDEELRRAAVYITDRKVIFNMVEGPHYKLRIAQEKTKQADTVPADGNRTISLINNFLEELPPTESTDGGKEKRKRKPTPADAAVDYVAYLMETEEEGDSTVTTAEVPQLKGQNLIDNFIENDKGKIVLSDTPQFVPQLEGGDGSEEKAGEEGYFTETLARIYIKQGRYGKALEIIRRLSLSFPKKNAYFADQIRFLEKLIINNNKNK